MSGYGGGGRSGHGRGAGGGRSPNKRGGSKGGGDRGRGNSQPDNIGRGRGDNSSRGRGNITRDRHQGSVIAWPSLRPTGQQAAGQQAKISSQSSGTGIENLSLAPTTRIPLRPAYGQQGEKFRVRANYFGLRADPTTVLNFYSVNVAPVGGANKLQGKALARLFALLLETLPKSVKIVTDFSGILITNATMGFTENPYPIKYFRETEEAADDNSPTYTAEVKYTNSFTLGSLLDYLNSEDCDQAFPLKDQIIQGLNIILGYSLKSSGNILTKTSRSARNKYFPINGKYVEKFGLAPGIEAYRGFFMSVRPSYDQILLNVQVQHIAAYEAQPLWKLLDDLRGGPRGLGWAEIEDMIKGVWVHANHLNKRLKRISGFARPQDGQKHKNPPIISGFASGADDIQFYKDTPKPAAYVTVSRHFMQQYNTKLRRPDLPLINVGTKESPIYMPTELCVIQTGQDYRARLSSAATASMIKFAVRPAYDNEQTVQRNGYGLIQQNCRETLRDFGLVCDQNLIEVQARRLNGFEPMYADPRTETNTGRKYADVGGNASNGSWNMKQVKFKFATHLSDWTFLWITTSRSSGSFENMGQVEESVNHFRNILSRYGMSTTKPFPGRRLNIADDSDPAASIDCFIQHASTAKVRLLLVILPDNGTAMYNAVKTAGDIKYGVHTVAVLGTQRKFAGHNEQYLANVALKVNMKLGGANQVLKNVDYGFLKEGKTMLVGMDVTHPAPGSAESAPSISCIAASKAGYAVQFLADVRVQTSRQEMIEHLKEMFKSRLAEWQKANSQALPEQIIIYRDGVGETMYDLVLERELPQIKEACREVYPATATKRGLPYMTVIICGKRHHTRFYPISKAQADRNGATRNGTVIDCGVTEPRAWDFYLQAHSALHGTPKSAHYVVIHDEIFRRRAGAEPSKDPKDKRTRDQRAVDEVERLTHALCYTFARATKAVSLVPPAYYADLVCDRARRHLSRVFDERSVTSGDAPARDEDVRVHPNLKETMYYI